MLIDRHNLRRDDAAIDVGRLSAMLDWAMPDMEHVVQEYRASAEHLGEGVAPGDKSPLARAQASTAYFRLRDFTFFANGAAPKLSPTPCGSAWPKTSKALAPASCAS